LFCLVCSRWAQSKDVFPRRTLSHFICPHRPASWAGSRATSPVFNSILHTAWLNDHALTLKRNTAKYYSDEKSSFLHTFQKICCESKKTPKHSNLNAMLLYGKVAMTCFK
jgi:hypothetical protein